MTDRTGASADASPVVVGGGIAGLVTAWELARAGLRPRLLESGPQVGGCIARHTVAGLDLDSGAESFATATTAVAGLIRELGLESSVVSPNPVGAWVRYAGDTAPLPRAALLGIPAHPFAADVRRVLGVAGAARAGLDLLLPAGFGAGNDARGSLGGLVRARMGSRVVDRLVEPVAGGVYSTDPDELDVDAVQPRLRAALAQTGSLAAAVRLLRGGGARPGAAVAGLEGGLFSLVLALRQAIESLDGTVSTGVGVSAVRPVDGGWHLTTSAGPAWTGTLVLAVPGPAAAALLGGIGIEVPSLSAGTSDVLLVTLVVDRRGLDGDPRGTGVLVSRHANGVRAKALTHTTAKWAWLAEMAGSGRHVLRLSYGRGDDAVRDAPPTDDGRLTDLALTDLALDDAATLTGVPMDSACLVGSAVVRWTSALPRPQPGHRVAMTQLRDEVGSRPGLQLTGSMVAGTGLAAVVADARAVAERIVSARTLSGA